MLIHSSLMLADTVEKLIAITLSTVIPGMVMVTPGKVIPDMVNRITVLQNMAAAYAIAVTSGLVVNGGVVAFVKY